MNNIIETSIDFGGFYGSIHGDNIDHLIEMYDDDESDNIFYWENIDYQKTYKNYIEEYCNYFSDFINEEYEILIEFKDIKLWSPQFYNFSTDVIDVSLCKLQAHNLNKILLKDTDFHKYLKKATQSYPGYISHYNYQEAINDKNDILIRYVFKYIVSKFDEVQYLGDFEYDIEVLDQNFQLKTDESGAM
mgnify:CR=1 FL=1